MARPGKKRKKVLFVLEIIVLLLFIGGLYVYGKVSSKLDLIEQPVLDEEKILVNEEAPQMTGYKTYALFGIDHRDKNESLGGENSDTIIIASVDNDNKTVKLVSLYRDTLLNIGSDTYAKANAAYAYGGPEQAISMLNTNLDLDITDYATVDFSALTTAVDCFGGLDIPLSYAEIVFMNDYCIETSKETGKSYTPVELPETEPEDIEAILGTYHLNGVQVTSYCRIRYTASLDMGRTERQRRVLQMLVTKAKTAGLTPLFDVMDQVFPMVKTSMTKTEILSMVPSLLGYSMDETTGFPSSYKFADVHNSSVIVATDLISNVQELHRFLYGDENYTPSSVVYTRSNRIVEIAGGEENFQDTAPVTTEEEEQTSDFIWQDTSTDTSSGSDYYDYSYDYGTIDDGSNNYDYDYDYDSGNYDYDDTYYDGGSDDYGGYDDNSYDDGSYDYGGYDDGLSDGDAGY